MTEHLNSPVVRIPVMAAIGTGANSGYLDINFTPDDFEPPDENFIQRLSIGKLTSLLLSRLSLPTKAHAKMLIYLLTGNESVLTNVKSCPVDNSVHIRLDFAERTSGCSWLQL